MTKTIKIYDKESDDLSTQLITELFNQVGMEPVYYTGYLYVFGDNTDNDLGAFGTPLHDIFDISCLDDVLYLKIKSWSSTRTIRISQPKFMITKAPMDCVYHCMYFCQTWEHEPEYYEDSYDIGGFCMMTGKEKDFMFNKICKNFHKKDE